MAVITTLILTRHGEAHCNVAHIVGGDTACTGLTDRGRPAARRTPIPAVPTPPAPRRGTSTSPALAPPWLTSSSATTGSAS
jgi:hypothetical protein